MPGLNWHQVVVAKDSRTCNGIGGGGAGILVQPSVPLSHCLSDSAPPSAHTWHHTSVDDQERAVWLDCGHTTGHRGPDAGRELKGHKGWAGMPYGARVRLPCGNSMNSQRSRPTDPQCGRNVRHDIQAANRACHAEGCLFMWGSVEPLPRRHTNYPLALNPHQLLSQRAEPMQTSAHMASPCHLGWEHPHHQLGTP